VQVLIYIKSTPPTFARMSAQPKQYRRPGTSRRTARRSDMESLPEIAQADTRSRETRVFVFLTVVLAPVLAVALVGSYGLLIWLYQMVMGPPKG